MKEKKYWILGAVLVICAGVLWAAKTPEYEPYKPSAGTFPSNWTFVKQGRDTLVGLQGVGVIIEPLASGAKEYGLIDQILQTDVELQLRQNGIKVLSQQELIQTLGMPFLWIGTTVVIMKGPAAGIAVVGLNVQFGQDVFLARHPSTYCLGATTWSKALTATVGTNNLVKLVREKIRDYVNIFINDYLAANPKEHSTDEKAPWRIEAKVGQDFVIDLPSNPSTGYSWRLARPLPSMLKLQRKRYIPPKVQKIGGGGTEVWTFKSVRSGKATIMFEYIRPWEKDSLPARERIFSVVAK